MRTLTTLCLALFCSVATAKQVELNPLWSGNWVAEEDGHHCSVRISADPLIQRSQITLICALGSVGVSANAPVDAIAFQIPLVRLNADFGTPASGVSVWGTATMFPFCDPLGPVLHVSVEQFAPPLAEWVNLRPESLDFITAAKLCGGAR